MSPLRVAIDCRLMQHRIAGIANYTRRLIQALARQNAAGLEISALLDRRDSDTQWLPPQVGVLRAVTPAHHPYERVALAAELAVLSRTAGFDVLHSPDFITCDGPFKKVVTIHDLYFAEHSEVLDEDGARYYGRTRWSAQRADRIIAVSAFTERDIVRLLGVPQRKITVVHEAHDNPELRRAGVLRPPEQPYVLFVGTFEPRKNVATLMQALAQTPPEVRLIVVGESGWVESEPSVIARALGVHKRVHFAGRVGDDELDMLYRNARMLVLPSLSEGFGLTVLEAMCRGIPVICSDSGSLPEIAGGVALLHNPRDAQQLAKSITRLWNDPAERTTLGERGMRRAAQFSWDLAAQQTLMVYRQA